MLVGLVLLALALRLPFLLVDGYADDQITWGRLAAVAAVRGFPQVYALELAKTSGVYPPVYYVALEFVGRLFAWSGEQTFTYTLLQNAWLKTVPVLGDLAIGGLVFVAARALGGTRRALFALAFFVCNSAIIYTSAYWGMFGDSLYTFFVIAALLSIQKNWVEAAACFLVLALNTKPQALFFAPLVVWALAYPVDLKKWARALAAGGVTFFIIWLPLLLTGTVRDALSTLRGTVDTMTVISANAHNFWFVVSFGQSDIEDMTRAFGVIPFRWFGIAALGCLYLICLLRLRPPYGANLYAAAAFIGFGCFVVLTQMHENYLYAVIALLAIVWLERRWLTILAFALTLFSLANMGLHDTSFTPDVFYNASRLGILRWLNSLLIVLTFGIVFYQLLRSNFLQPKNDPIL